MSHGLPNQLPRGIGDDLSRFVGQDHPLPRNLPYLLDQGLHIGPVSMLSIVLGQEHLEAPVAHHPPVLHVAMEHPGGDLGAGEGNDPHRCYHDQDQRHDQAKTEGVEHVKSPQTCSPRRRWS